ncbi:putative uncharacterized protein DDB_G0282133 isoform X3 [Contarinia nasturtii]|uniref:putative uncharacterized protein DDB_G0282133 isoform X3 n=1 Tax=Contarinia nasturtii TaxID=265458 RepID=UPI0012D421D4|nr:putative uncharacterized protein DDB_G0282133 isoform X3 [Contarinia nasturtii]
MSAGLMSCVRENSTPITMENSGAASLSSKSQESHKRRRRFHPLRNLRRIFRRRTLTHADAIRPMVQQNQNFYNRNEVFNVFCFAARNHEQYENDLSNVSTIRSLSAQSINDDVLPDDFSDFQSSRLIRSANQSNLTTNKRTYGYAKDETENRLNHHHPGIMDLNTEIDTDLTREMIDYQRSLSEGRLLDNDFSRETLSRSHDSVFSESATASSLSIVLKAELADALRKRKNRSDASYEDLGLPSSPATPPRNGSHVVDGQINSTNIVGRHQHHSSLGLLSMVSSDSMEPSNFLSNSKSSNAAGKLDATDEIFPPEISLNSSHEFETKLSHSAAKHKMAIRPKKKGPSRPSRKPTEEASNVLILTPEVHEDFLKSSDIIETYVGKSQSLPRGVNSISNSKSNEKHTISTPPNTQIKSKLYKTSEFDCRDQKYSVESNLETKTLNLKREDRINSEEGFFRRFINRSGRKHKKEHEHIDTDTPDANKSNKKCETSTPAIKKSAELSIINVLSNARAKDTPIESKSSYLSTEEVNKSPKSLIMKNDKLRSGPISRQRYTKDVNEISDPIDVARAQKLSSNSTRYTSYLRFSPNKSIQNQCDDESDRSHYHSEEILSTTSGAIAADDPNTPFSHDDNDDGNYKQVPCSVSLPKNGWPNENKLTYSALSRNGHSWGQCQQKISKMANDQQSTIKTYHKGKMVEKSKSFRLYTKNFNHENIVQIRNDCKPTLCPSLPDLNASNRSPLARPLRYSTNRENLQSLRFMNSSGGQLNAGANTKWTPTRSSSSSRISEHRFGSDRFEINDMNLIPTSKLYSTLNTSDEIATYDIEKDKTQLMTGTGAGGDNTSVLPVAAKHHSFQNTNINEIEDNIDKIMKSAVVTVLKPSTELYQFKTNNSNINMNVATIDNPPLIRHSTTATKLDLQVPSSSSSSSSPPHKKISADIPEFMQIQLNRVDASRPKSCIEYLSSAATPNDNVTASNASIEEDKERRFSNESIEISDKKKVAINSSIMNVFNSNLNKSSESLKSIGFCQQSRTLIGDQQLSRGSSISELNKTSTMSDNHSSDDCLDLDLDDENDECIVIERRKSFSDKKLKFEQQIEKIQADLKRSTVIGVNDKAANVRKLSLEDENISGPILRGKKTNKSIEPDDPTPELIKVFARRSLKIKDTDEYQVHNDAERETLNQKMNDVDSSNDTNSTVNRINNIKNSNKRFNTDSDKENYMSSGCAHSTVPKVEIYIKPNEKCEEVTPIKDSPANKNNVDMTSVKSIGKLFNGSANRFSPTPITNSIFSNNYRNSTAFFENLSPSNQARSTSKQTTNNTSQDNEKDNGIILENINNKLNTNTYNNFTKTATTSIDRKSGDDATKNPNSKPTTVVHNDSNNATSTQDSEFMNILERKAQWEKRANAFK